jgi:hypothetical protein
MPTNPEAPVTNVFKAGIINMIRLMEHPSPAETGRCLLDHRLTAV